MARGNGKGKKEAYPQGGSMRSGAGKAARRKLLAAELNASRKRPRAVQLFFPEEAQAAVCGLLCVLRRRELDPASEDARRLARYEREPRKVLRELVSRGAAVEDGAAAAADAHADVGAPARPARPLGERVRLNLVTEGSKGGGGGGKKRAATAKLLVVKRTADTSVLLAAARKLLKPKKGCDPWYVYELDTGLELHNTLSVPDGAKVCVTADAAPVSNKATPSSEKKKKSSSSSAPDEARRRLPLGSKIAWDDNADTPPDAGAVTEEESPRPSRDDDADAASPPEEGDGEEAAPTTEDEAMGLLPPPPTAGPTRAYYRASYDARLGSEAYRRMLKRREPLPAYARRDEIAALCRANDFGVVVVAGATGCGKSTQVPQLIVDDADAGGRGAETRVVVTQPRRVAAIALAERVSQERAERCLGHEDVGYAVRLEKKGSRARTRIEFVTVGLLLRRLQSDATGGLLEGISHIIVDEAHERDLLTDFLLVVLKTKLLPRRRAANRPLTVVVMSATLDARLFLDYFADYSAAFVDIPGRLHPVEERYIEAAVALVTAQPSKAEGLGRMAKPTVDASSKRPSAVVLSPEVRSPLDCEAVAAVVVSIVRDPGRLDRTGAVLVFVPGAAEIEKVCRELQTVLAAEEAWVLPMHSGLTSRDQRRVFQRPPSPATQTKVVVSTNIAETSVTIDDVTDVVDTGRVREIRYDLGVSKLAECYVSKAAARQRAGRAGRVRAGRCWRLYPVESYEADWPDHTAPEMIRTPLDNLILQILRLGLGQPMPFLRAALQPPAEAAMEEAIVDLASIGCLRATTSIDEANSDDDDGDASSSFDEEEEEEEPPDGEKGLFDLSDARAAGLEDDDDSDDDSGGDGASKEGNDTRTVEAAARPVRTFALTPLGYHVASLPMDCRIAKLLLYGSVFECVESTLTIAAGLSVAKDVFFAPHHKRREASAKKQKLAKDSDSDLVALVFAYDGWKQQCGDARAQRDYCADWCLDGRALLEVDALREHYRHQLEEASFPSREAPQATFSLALLKSLVCAGLYPQCARIQTSSDTGASVLVARDGARWWCHPSSVNFEQIARQPKQRFLVYSKRLVTTKPYIIDTSLVSPLALILFGGSLAHSLDRSRLVLDGWLAFKATEYATVTIIALRKELDALFKLALTTTDAASVARARDHAKPTVDALRNILARL